MPAWEELKFASMWHPLAHEQPSQSLSLHHRIQSSLQGCLRRHRLTRPSPGIRKTSRLSRFRQHRHACTTYLGQLHDHARLCAHESRRRQPLQQIHSPARRVGKRETNCTYLIVTNADTVCATAKEARAEIVIKIADMSYGGRAFTCRDPEGHLWTIGTYDPWDTTDPDMAA